MMEYFRNLITRTREEKGASAVEYGLLIAGIAALIVVVVFAIGPLLQDAFGDTCDTIQSKSDTPGTCARS